MKLPQSYIDVGGQKPVRLPEDSVLALIFAAPFMPCPSKGLVFCMMRGHDLKTHFSPRRLQSRLARYSEV
jgi:hypothetical protein